MFLLLKIPTGLPQKAAKGDLWAQAAPRDHEPWLMTDGNGREISHVYGTVVSKWICSSPPDRWEPVILSEVHRPPSPRPAPQPRAADSSGHYRTSTASSRSQWALPDLNCERQISVLRQINCERKMSHRMPDGMSDRISDGMSERVSDRRPDRMSD